MKDDPSSDLVMLMWQESELEIRIRLIASVSCVDEEHDGALVVRWSNRMTRGARRVRRRAIADAIAVPRSPVTVVRGVNHAPKTDRDRPRFTGN
jgi:hypothetical protein